MVIIMARILVEENNIHIVFDLSEDGKIKLLHFSALPFQEESIDTKSMEDCFQLVEINLSGLDRPNELRGMKYIVTSPGYRMKYREHKDYRNDLGRKLEFDTFDEETGIAVISHLQFYDGISVVRFYNEVMNEGNDTQTLEYISSFHYTGIEKEGLLPRDEKMLLKIPHNSWQREMDWQTYTL
ncbi:MAG TPA: alpha-galactosidase, partial [Mobilitalea sp.]|nr:alpha-galactosidase [Mobilitalea sp.]